MGCMLFVMCACACVCSVWLLSSFLSVRFLFLYCCVVGAVFVLYSRITVKLQITKTLCTIIEMTFVAKVICSFLLCACVYSCVGCCCFPLKSILQVKSLSGIIDECRLCLLLILSFHLVFFYLCVIVLRVVCACLHEAYVTAHALRTTQAIYNIEPFVNN